MGKYTLTVTPRAEHVLDGIYEYGAQKFNDSYARKFVSGLVKQIKSLRSQPKLGFKEPMLEGHPLDYRSLVIHKFFKAIYFIDEPSKVIYVVDIWDTRMIPDNLSDRI